MIQVLIIDDHETVRMGVSAYLETQTDMNVVGEAANGEEGVEAALRLKPDVVIMDLVMAGMDGVEATAKIMEKWSQAKVMVVTSFLDDDKLVSALEAGAASYLLKTSSAEEIAEAIRRTNKGQTVLAEQVQGKMMSLYTKERKPQLHEELTKRELEILQLMTKGRTNQEIAEELYIAIKTVKTHVSHILSKLEVQDRTQAVVYAFETGLFE